MRALAGLAAILVFTAPAAQAQLLRANVAQGALAGAARGKVAAFLGIPYAAPPVGGLRWRAPQPAPRWSGVRDATRFGANCYQYTSASQAQQRAASVSSAELGPYTAEFFPPDLPSSEDCLLLNIWTPAKSVEDKLAVLVWIHGGAFLNGSGSVPLYDGAALASRGIVVVTINYRLGPLGFLAHPELTQESGRAASGNYGLMDQVAALQWVRANIRAFGGDPQRVTIAGQSAGAVSVQYLIASPLGQGLFRGAIVESRYDMGYPGKRLSDAEREGVAFAKINRARSVEDLRAIPADAFEFVPQPEPEKRAVSALVASPPRFQFVPVVDGWVVPDDPDAVVARGEHNDTPILAGMTRNEANRELPETIGAAAFTGQLRDLFGASAAIALPLYPAAADADAARMAAAVRCDRGLASLYTWASSRLKSSSQPFYGYLFTHTVPVVSGPSFGAFHSAELPYVFRTFEKSPRPFDSRDRELSEAVSSYWVNFVQRGDPNAPGLPEWPALDTRSRRIMHLGSPLRAQPILETRKLQLFRELSARGGLVTLF